MVSVIISTYQHEEYIRGCIDSVLSQETDFSFEVIIGEDASTDGTRSICKEYADTYPDKIRLFLHNRENNIEILGNPTGRFQVKYSHGMARGRYIAFCEGDDYWIDDSKLQRQVDFMEKNPDFSACFHNTWMKHEDSRKDHFMNHLLTDHIFTMQDLMLRPWFIAVASLLHRNYFFSIEEWDLVSIEGAFCKLYMLGDRGPIKYLNRVMSVYRVHDKGLAQKIRNKLDSEVPANWVMMYAGFDEYTEQRHRKFTDARIEQVCQGMLKRGLQLSIKENPYACPEDLWKVYEKIKECLSEPMPAHLKNTILDGRALKRCLHAAFLNAGNLAFKKGKPWHALAHYREARRILPRDFRTNAYFYVHLLGPLGMKLRLLFNKALP